MKPDRRMLNKMRTKGGVKTKALEKGREGWTIELDDMGAAEYAAKSYVDAISKPADTNHEPMVDKQGRVVKDEDDK
jgi:hypothetical protein